MTHLYHSLACIWSHTHTKKIVGMPTNRSIEKENIVRIHKNHGICRKMMGLENYYFKWNKRDRKTNIKCFLSNAQPRFKITGKCMCEWVCVKLHYFFKLLVVEVCLFVSFCGLVLFVCFIGLFWSSLCIWEKQTVRTKYMKGKEVGKIWSIWIKKKHYLNTLYKIFNKIAEKETKQNKEGNTVKLTQRIKQQNSCTCGKTD